TNTSLSLLVRTCECTAVPIRFKLIEAIPADQFPGRVYHAGCNSGFRIGRLADSSGRKGVRPEAAHRLQVESRYPTAGRFQHYRGYRIFRHTRRAPVPAGSIQCDAIRDPKRTTLLPHRPKSTKPIHEQNAMEYFRCRVGLSRASSWSDKAAQPRTAIPEFIH